MGRKCIEVSTLYGLTINELDNIVTDTKSNYTRAMVQAVIMRHQGARTAVIADTLGKCVTTIESYIKEWNKSGLEAIKDHRGNNIPSSLTDDMINDIQNTVLYLSPHDLGYPPSKWNCNLLTRYVEEKYGKKYSDTWLRKLLKNLGFTCKRGIFRPTPAASE